MNIDQQNQHLLNEINQYKDNEKNNHNKIEELQNTVNQLKSEIENLQKESKFNKEEKENLSKDPLEFYDIIGNINSLKNVLWGKEIKENHFYSKLYQEHL